jgi:hypothetical protein
VATAVVLAALLISSIYFVLTVDRLMLGGDQVRWVPMIEEMFQGQLDLWDLWQGKGGHRAPAYIATFLANARFFGLDMQLEQIIGALAWITAGILVVVGTRRHMDASSRTVLAALTLALLPLLVVNGQVMNIVLAYSLISLRMIDLTLFVLVFLLLSHNLTRPPAWRSSGVLVVLLGFSSLFFGRGWGQAMLVSTAATLVLYTISCRRKLAARRLLITVLPLFGAALFCIYTYQLGLVGAAGGNKAGVAALLDVHALLSFSTTLVGRTLTFAFIDVAGGKNLFWIQLVGTLVILAYAGATWIFFAQRQYERSWFPLSLMLFSAGAVLLVYLGRGVGTGWGWQGALWPRHLPECSVGLAGVMTIFSSAASIKPARKWLSGALAGIIVALIVNQSMAVAQNVQRAPFIKNYWAKRSTAFFGPTEAFADPAVAKTAMCHYEELCISARATIERYGLMPAARAEYAPGPDSR